MCSGIDHTIPTLSATYRIIFQKYVFGNEFILPSVDDVHPDDADDWTVKLIGFQQTNVIIFLVDQLA